ncbi:hypothetical protein C823_001679 [Eubacterium plexicaudatum ASF492]|uniref:CRISPR-associated exonuclease Cas4 n=1 Tax=Eubacterium plexicaudatum ASF492 TaxID=1235802 RepID=N2B765_9FIRM|nr:hypothetical protein C823_001679 [Eubacterium plexicaudatum ASF492]
MIVKTTLLLYVRGEEMDKRVTGVMIYYYFVCKRKLWYFTHEITMESENEDVLLGKLLDENSYQKNDKHINIDNIINIDFIKEQKELHEIKKSRAMEEAGIWQVKYYLYYLKQRGVIGLKAKIDYPLLKKNMLIELSEEDESKLNEIITEIYAIKEQLCPPHPELKKRCMKCAYYDLCVI